MTTLATTPASVDHVAVQNGFSAFVTGVGAVFASLGRAIAFSRQCEAEFNRKGEISPETLNRFLHQV